MHPFHTIIEPFRIKSVEALKFTTREERAAALEKAEFNVFRLVAEDVPVVSGRTESKTPTVLLRFVAVLPPLAFAATVFAFDLDRHGWLVESSLLIFFNVPGTYVTQG